MPSLLEQRLREQMVNLERGSSAEEMLTQLEPAHEIASAEHSGQHVEQGIEARASTPSVKVVWTHTEVPALLAQRTDKRVKRVTTGAAGVVRIGTDKPQVNIEHSLSGARVTTPQECMDIPEQELVGLALVVQTKLPILDKT